MRMLTTLILTMVILSGCAANQAQNGAMLGTLSGATIGALTAKNKGTGAVLGAGAGMLVGYLIGNEMDKMDSYDKTQIADTLEHTPSGQTRAWVNPDTRMQYEARPEPARRQRDGRIVRDVTLHAQMADGSHQTVYAKAYRRPDGSWQLEQ